MVSEAEGWRSTGAKDFGWVSWLGIMRRFLKFRKFYSAMEDCRNRLADDIPATWSRQMVSQVGWNVALWYAIDSGITLSFAIESDAILVG
jgi:hypothetical protein